MRAVRLCIVFFYQLSLIDHYYIIEFDPYSVPHICDLKIKLDLVNMDREGCGKYLVQPTFENSGQMSKQCVFEYLLSPAGNFSASTY